MCPTDKIFLIYFFGGGGGGGGGGGWLIAIYLYHIFANNDPVT